MSVRIHIGAHKTATTHLQKAFSQARPALAERNFGYAGPGRLRAGGCNLADCLREPGKPSDNSRLMAQRLQKWRADHADLLISEENILGGTRKQAVFGDAGELYPRAVPRLRYLLTLLNRPRATVFLSVRDPAQFAVSSFFQQLVGMKEVTVEDYLEGIDVTRLHWSGLVARISAMPSVSRVVVWRFEDYPALRPRLNARLTRPDLAPLIPDPAPNNTSMSQEAYDLFVSRAIRDLQTPLKKLLRDAMEELPKGPGRPGLRPLDEALYRASAENYARDIDRIAALPGVELLRPDAAQAG
ncbi:MAG: hypothetical protein Q4G36_00900 [Paracoccus sp. (in: a-proteobacteria)]|nr:hypothetical protein [Paracoccus sp. (in: a-proteobacteria)]